MLNIRFSFLVLELEGDTMSFWTHEHRASIAKKKRLLGLEGCLKGRHLTPRQRVGLLEIIEIAEDCCLCLCLGLGSSYTFDRSRN